MRNKISHIAILLATAMLCGCYHNVHDYEEPVGPKPDDTGYLAASLEWELPEDEGTPVDNLHFHVTDGKGTDTDDDCESVDEAADWLKRLTVGEYDILVTADMTAADGYRLEDGVVSLVDPTSSPQQAWFAMAHATVVNDEVTLAEFQLQRLMATVCVTITGVPDRATIDIAIDHMAQSVDLKARDANGRLGLSSREYVRVPLPSDYGPAATRALFDITSGSRNLLPTARDYDRTYIDLEVTTPGGKHLFCLGDTPRMDSGKTYVVTLDYDQLRPYMYFDSYTINPWTEGWVVNGEVLNPEE